MFKSVPSIVAGFLAFAIIVVGICYTSFLIYNSQKKDQDAFKIAIVQDQDDFYTNLALDFIDDLDIIKKTFIIDRVTEDEASTGMRSGKYDMAFFFPDDYAKQLYHSEDVQIDIRFGTEKTSTTSYVVFNMTNFVTSYLIESERSIFALNDLYYETGKTGRWDAQNGLNLLYFEILLNRLEIFNDRPISPLDVSDMITHFLCVGIILLLLFSALSLAGILEKSDLSFYRKLKAEGLGGTSQVIARYLSVTIIFSAIYISLILVLFAIMAIAKIDIGSYLPVDSIPTLEYSLLTSGNGIILLCLLKGVVIILPLTAFIVLIYELAPNAGTATLTYFISVLVLAFVSGLFFPQSFLPSSFTNIAGFTFTKASYEFLTAIFYDLSIYSAFGKLVLFTLIFLGLGIITRNYNLTKQGD